jgi:DNA-binding CsgD family transcriptional regulator
MTTLSVDLRTSERVAVFAFNVDGRLLYRNEKAQSLALKVAADASAAVPQEILQLCRDVAQAIQCHGDLLGSGHVRRETRRGNTMLVLKGFTIPSPQTEQGPLILVLAELATSNGNFEAGNCEDFGLTKHEQDVLALLGHGLTTPEIAAQLRISEQRADDQVRALMRKANVTNRTAVLTELLRVRAAKLRHLTSEEDHGM